MRLNRMLVVFLIPSLSCLANEAEWFRVQPGVQFDFPKDHGSHPDYQTEWWYATGQVSDNDGNEFGYQFTIFRFGINPDSNNEEVNLTPYHLLAGHVAITGINDQKFMKAERIRRAGAGFAEAVESHLHSWIGDWEIVHDEDDTLSITATDQDNGFSIQLQLDPVKSPTFHGDNGYSQKGDEVGNASAYYSWTRLKTSGQLKIGDITYEVNGTSWFDHEYGSSQLGKGVAGWDWFSIHFDDKSELMLYQLRKEEGGAIPQSSATIVKKNGDVITVNQEDWTLTPLSFWKSEETGANYPIKWQLEIPKHQIDVRIEARVKHTEMVTKESTNVTYWEGPIHTSGTHTGTGYMELTGYAEIFSNTF